MSQSKIYLREVSGNVPLYSIKEKALENKTLLTLCHSAASWGV